MTLSRQEVVPGLTTELENFVELLRTLGPDEWRQLTRCDGWTAGDVAAHVVATIADVTAGRIEGLGTPEVTRRQVEERRGRTPSELADELEGSRKAARDIAESFDDDAWAGPAPGGFPGTLGWAVESLWYDTYLHADDIRAAIGRPTVRGDGIRAGIHHVAAVLEQQEWGPATLAFDGIGEIPIRGGGDRVTGDPFQFLLAATGRADPPSVGLDESVNIYR